VQNSSDERILRKIYGEIVAGYSLADYFEGLVYIKHANPLNLLEFDFKYQKKYEQLLKDGIVSEKEKTDLLIRDGIWDSKKEEKITDLRATIQQLYNTKRNHYAPREIQSYNEQIKTNEGFLIELLTEKMSLIGSCAETISRRVLDTEQIVASFYKDDKLQQPMFGAVDDIQDETLDLLFEIYEQFCKNVSDLSIRRISVTEDFQSMFGMAENLFYFYGKAVSQLTSHQVKLAQYGGYYKAILFGDPRPPDEIRHDPVALEDWFFARTNIQKIMDKDENEGKTTSFFGMSKKELSFLGVEVETASQNSLSKLADEKGEVTLDRLKKFGHI
jgi:hypothetical protein